MFVFDTAVRLQFARERAAELARNYRRPQNALARDRPVGRGAADVSLAVRRVRSRSVARAVSRA